MRVYVQAVEKRSPMTPPKAPPNIRKKTAVASLKLRFVRERETKGTQRFEEEGPKEGHRVGYLYLKKDADSKLGCPENLEVTITGAV